MPYLIMLSKDAALDRSKVAWEAVLGHKKNPRDITEYLWGIAEGGGKLALRVDSKADLLLPAEQAALVSSLDG
jgi:hypothetical protein